MAGAQPVFRDDLVHDFLVGVAVASTFAAALLVGFEVRGALAGAPVEYEPLLVAVGLVVTTVGGVVHRRRQL